MSTNKSASTWIIPSLYPSIWAPSPCLQVVSLFHYKFLPQPLQYKCNKCSKHSLVYNISYQTQFTDVITVSGREQMLEPLLSYLLLNLLTRTQELVIFHDAIWPCHQEVWYSRVWPLVTLLKATTWFLFEVNRSSDKFDNFMHNYLLTGKSHPKGR